MLMDNVYILEGITVRCLAILTVCNLLKVETTCLAIEQVFIVPM